jgi:pyridoxal phosphate enzyme (YggS family)
MTVTKENYSEIINELKQKNARLVAVSKTKSVEDILELYRLGQRDFGENYVQELVEKQAQLPKDIQWHFIGHLQSNKVKQIVPFVHLIHSIDSFKLLKEVDKQALKIKRTVDVLLQVHIAQEETKFGFDESEVNEILDSNKTNLPELKALQIKGLMGMASFTDDKEQVKKELHYLKSLFDRFAIQHPSFTILSMGMSGDYKIALQEGSNMIRIGSLLFGERSYAG